MKTEFPPAEETGDPAVVEPTDTTTETERPTWWQTGNEGRITVIHRLESPTGTPWGTASGTFAAELPEHPFLAACSQENLLCWDELPTRENEPVEYSSTPFVMPDGIEWKFVGNQFFLDDIAVPLVQDVESGLVAYSHTLPRAPGDGQRFDLTLEGEWGEFSEADVLRMPGDIRFTAPGPPREVMALDASETSITFEWEAEADSEMYAMVYRIDGTRQIFYVEDDGEWELEKSEVGEFTELTTVFVDFMRLRTFSIDINDNSLEAQTIVIQPVIVSPDIPRSCKEIFEDDPQASTGTYTIAPTPGAPQQVYCDMDVDGGGWTLVASSGGSTFDDAGSSYYPGLANLSPQGQAPGVWQGMRAVINDRSDIRFTCKTQPAGSFAVDLSFYNTIWYREISTGTDAQSCFNEGDGTGADPAPRRTNNITGETKNSADQWSAGFLEGEDFCDSVDDFTVDFDDRGMDSDISDGTDWGEDDNSQKCGVAGLNSGAWFIFVRE